MWAETRYKQQQTEFQNERRQTHIYYFLPNSCLYIVHLGLGPFFLDAAKKSGNIGLLKISKPKFRSLVYVCTMQHLYMETLYNSFLLYIKL